MVHTAKTDTDPWGVVLKGTSQENIFQNRREMQGHEREMTFRLNRINFGARTYNPTIGRFDKVDPLTEKGKGWSPYTYVFNNPILFVDPDGLWGDFYDQKGNKVGTDNKNDGKVYVVTDRHDIKDIKKSGGLVNNVETIKSAIELPSAFVRSEMGNSVDRAEAPTIDDLKGGFHEEGGIFGEGVNRKETVIHAKSGSYSDPSIVDRAEVNVFSGETSTKYLKTVEGIFHTHPSGTIVKGNTTYSFGQEPSNLNGIGDIPNAVGKPYNSYVLSPKVNKVYIYNGNGVQATFPLKQFRTIGNK